MFQNKLVNLLFDNRAKFCTLTCILLSLLCLPSTPANHVLCKLTSIETSFSFFFSLARAKCVTINVMVNLSCQLDIQWKMETPLNCLHHIGL